MQSPRWTTVQESEFPWEREALAHLRELLPDAEPFRAWANFEFIGDDGSINEVDLLVVSLHRIYLVEIKSPPGRVEGDAGTWRWTEGGRTRSTDNPLLLANRKAKKLKSLLSRQQAMKRLRVPYVEAAVFLSHQDVQCALEGAARTGVYLRAGAARDGEPHVGELLTGAQLVLNKVRGWAARVGEIKITEDGRNPVLSVHLVGVDTEGILENAKAFDNYGNRIFKIRTLLWEMLGITGEETLLPPKHRILWKGTQRETEVYFRNVRELPLESFPPQDAEWRIVVDYPFDQQDYTPADDFAKVQEYLQQHPPIRTLVWIPAFFTAQSLNELGRLVVLDHVLTGTRLDEYGAHLSQLDREQARVILVNQRDQVRQRIRNFMLAAYGLTTVNRDALDLSWDPETYVQALDPGLKLQAPVGATLREGLENLFQQALRHQYPAHPDFVGEVKIPGGLRKVWDVVRRAVEAPDRRVEVDRADREEVLRIAVPLRLGLVGEAHFVLADDWVRDFQQKQAQDGVAELTVGRLRGWIDRPQARGLPREVANLVILTYALQTNRTFLHYGGVVEPTLDRLPDELELREEPLPDEAAWRAAVERAGAILGLTVPPQRTAGNVARLAEQAADIAKNDEPHLTRYAAILNDRLARLEIEGETPPRLRTARAAQALEAAVARAKREQVASVLARAEVATSAAAMGTARGRAKEASAALETAKWELLVENLQLPEPFGARAARTLERVRDALRADEHATPLAAALREAEAEALALLQEAARAPRPPQPEPRPDPQAPPAVDAEPSSGPSQGGQRTVRAAEVNAVLDEVRQEAEEAPDALIEVTWRIVRG